MYPITPLYVNRQYAASDSLYKVHAAAKISPLRRQNAMPLFEMLQQESGGRTQAASMPAPGTAGTGASPSFDRAAPSLAAKPYNPYGRFREPGFDSGNPPPRPLNPDRQTTFERRYAAMANAYEPAARTGGMLYREM